MRELDALIEKYLTDAHAVVPLPNPKFDPSKYKPENIGKQPGGLKVGGETDKKAKSPKSAPNEKL